MPSMCQRQNFGYRSERKDKRIYEFCHILPYFANLLDGTGYCLNLVIPQKKFLEIWQLWCIFFTKFHDKFGMNWYVCAFGVVGKILMSKDLMKFYLVRFGFRM
jgi:hypothetical protein